MRRGAHPLSEDRLLFDGPRATYGRFRVLHQIGAGSVGPIFRGEDSETSQPVAVTVVRVGLPRERAALASAALAALRERLPSHPAIPAMLATGLVDDEPYVVTTLADGDPLDSALRQFGPAQLVDAVPRLRVVADALDTAAALGLSHGRLHPRDVLVSVEATAVTGLGLVPLLERLGVTIAAARPYAAPEVAQGGGSSPAADQHALGAMAYEWLTGRPAPPPDGMRLALAGLNPEDQAALSAAIARAMAVDPGERYSTSTAFVESLSACLPAATPRVRTSRKPARQEVPRLAFDDDDRAVAPPPLPDLELRRPDDVVEPDAALHVDIGATVPPPLDIPIGSRPDAYGAAGEANASDDAPAPPIEAQARDVVDAVDAVDGGERPTLDRYMAVDDDETAIGEPVRDGAQPLSEGPVADQPLPWTRWAIGVAACAALMVVGGWILLRVGTPSAPAGEGTAVTASSAPTTASSPPAATSPTSTVAAAGPASSPARAPAAPDAEAPAVTRPAAVPAATAPDVPAAKPAGPPLRKPGPARSRPAAAPPAARPEVPRAARATAPAAARLAGRLLVRSTPTGAEVFVNGSRRGVTPLAVRDLGLGTYAVRVVRPGFAPAEQRVVLDAGRPSRAVEVALSRAAGAPTASPAAMATGVLVVDSRPAGARVTIDGASAGVTPLTIATIAAGTHAVRIDQAGFAPIQTTARVEAGGKARVAVTLTPERFDP